MATTQPLSDLEALLERCGEIEASRVRFAFALVGAYRSLREIEQLELPDEFVAICKEAETFMYGDPPSNLYPNPED